MYRSVRGFQRAAAVGKQPVHHVTVVILRYRVLVLVQHYGDLITIPDRHTAESGSNIGQYLPGLSLVGEIHVADEARLLTPETIRHLLVAVTGDLIERPLVDVLRAQATG